MVSWWNKNRQWSVSTTGNGQWRSVIHPVHIRFNRETKRRFTFLRRIYGVCWLHLQKCFQHEENDIFWCTADVGWVTGHSYITYGPLLAGATCVMFEGVPNYPDASRFWQVIEKHQVTQFYTAPTAIRALMVNGSDIPKNSKCRRWKLLVQLVSQLISKHGNGILIMSEKEIARW